jgi:hypothetical protein
VRESSHNNTTDAFQSIARIGAKGAGQTGQDEMIAIVERLLKAEGAGDVDGAVAVDTDDVVHDALGFPGSPARARRRRASSIAS